MKHLAPSLFRAFSCAAGACPDSCCRAGWEIVPDEETLALYETLPGPDGARTRAGIVPACRGGHWPPKAPDDSACRGGHWPPEAPDEPLLRQDENRVCVLLDPDGLCHVQRSFGHGALCRVCREYPRFHREFGNLTEHGLSLSCPTAYALATARAPAWEEWEDQAPIVPNELDPAAYLRLRRGRELALELLTRENVPFGQRLLLLRRLAAAMEAAPERRIRHDYEVRLRRWSTLPTQRRDKPCLSGLRSKQSPGGRSIASGRSKRFAPGKLHSFRMPDKQGLSLHPEQEGAANCRCLARRFLELEILSPVWRDALERFLALAEAGELPENPLLPLDPEPYARWLWYELYKYWLDALDDGALLARVDRALLMLALGLAMDRALPGEGPFLRRLSREIEHCEENLAALLAFCRNNPEDTAPLLRLLLDI
ncbi:MAG: flagellin lysine-N-methylase [Oscillospiraceae bacterium]|nr:flagellin lysine-N-methylase [Oscillospiraceae bacterium]